ncbi:MAG: threonylcarbamoyl-AMP synthase [Flavobacteriales bacterium]|nr:threonylcarbamoyl-AMP synthase [Flavobacteriales bacterium]
MTIGVGLERAQYLLEHGDVVAIPTETVYGLAANAFDIDAVLKVFEVKQRPSFDPLIVHIGRKEQVRDVAKDIPPEARALIDRFWPGPLTLVLPKQQRLPDIVTSGLDTVGVRMPAHPLTLELLRSLDFPLAAPSANPFGYVSPTTAQHVADQLGEQVPYILDGGPCSVGVESTIIGFEPVPVLYRAGGIPVEEIEALIGPVSTTTPHSLGEGPGVRSPGMLLSHYAPRKRVIVGDVPDLMRTHQGKRIGVISFSQDHGAAINEVLSPSGDLHEAARGLFAALRRLDSSHVDLILAEVFPEEGLGRAINDRLRRAAGGVA